MTAPKVLPGLEPLLVPIENLSHLPGNARQGDPEAVAKSLERFGQRCAHRAVKGPLGAFGQHKDASCYDLEMPVCGICELDLPVEEFEPEPKMKCGHRGQCRSCRKRRKLDAYYRNREAIRIKRSEKHAADPTKNRERALAYYYANREERIKARSEHRKKNPEQGREQNNRRRASMLNNGSEPYLRSEVFDSDGWICQLCDGPVSRDLQWPDPQYPTIDHIVPISRGGSDSRDNVRLAHFLCNQRRFVGNHDV